MNKRKTQSHTPPWLFIPLLLGIFHLQAREQEMLAETWVIQPKTGMEQAFETTLKEHSAHRAKLGDPRIWHIYTPVLGKHLNRYIVRSCCFEWKDMDSYHQWNLEKAPMHHWNMQVDDKVSHYSRYLDIQDIDNSHWPDGVEANFVGVSRFRVKPGHWTAMKADIKTISDIATKNNWPHHWKWSYAVGGRQSMSLMLPFKNYADMAPPEQKFSALLVKHFGSEEKAREFWQNWANHFDSTHYSIYRHRKDLSMQHKK